MGIFTSRPIKKQPELIETAEPIDNNMDIREFHKCLSGCNIRLSKLKLITEPHCFC